MSYLCHHRPVYPDHATDREPTPTWSQTRPLCRPELDIRQQCVQVGSIAGDSYTEEQTDIDDMAAALGAGNALLVCANVPSFYFLGVWSEGRCSPTEPETAQSRVSHVSIEGRQLLRWQPSACAGNHPYIC